MPIDVTWPPTNAPKDPADGRANFQAALDGIAGAGQIFTTGSPFTIHAASFGDSMDFWLAWNAAGTGSVTLSTGVAFGKTFHCTRLGAGDVSVEATNVSTGAAATTAQYDSLVFRSLGDDTWIRMQAA